MPTASYIHGNYDDEVLSMPRADGSGVIRDFYYHQDDLFNVTLVTDAGGAASLAKRDGETRAAWRGGAAPARTRRRSDRRCLARRVARTARRDGALLSARRARRRRPRRSN